MVKKVLTILIQKKSLSLNIHFLFIVYGTVSLIDYCWLGYRLPQGTDMEQGGGAGGGAVGGEDEGPRDDWWVRQAERRDESLGVTGLENVEERINRQGAGEGLDIFQFINDLKDKQENIAF